MTKRKPGEPGKGWSKGTHRSDSEKRAISIAHLGHLNPMWKGDNVGNNGLHAWLKRHLPKPTLCQLCNDKSPYDLANITGIYSRDFDNWKYLCRRCHMDSDGRIANFYLGRHRPKHV